MLEIPPRVFLRFSHLVFSRHLMHLHQKESLNLGKSKPWRHQFHHENGQKKLHQRKNEGEPDRNSSWGKGRKIRLRFSTSDNDHSEKLYTTHFLLPKKKTDGGRTIVSQSA